MVIDEPTRRLDLASEVAVAAALAELHDRVTLAIVAYCLSTLSTYIVSCFALAGALRLFGTVAGLVRDDSFLRRASEPTGANVGWARLGEGR